MKRPESFNLFLKYFPEEKLPITLSPDSASYFSEKNAPLPAELIHRFILQKEAASAEDEYTEYMACCRIPGTGDIHAVIYWRGRLMEYDFILCTFNRNGILLSRKMIAGIRSDGRNIKTCIATIDEDWIIEIIAGEQAENDEVYDPSASKLFSLELMSNGEIIGT